MSVVPAAGVGGSGQSGAISPILKNEKLKSKIFVCFDVFVLLPVGHWNELPAENVARIGVVQGPDADSTFFLNFVSDPIEIVPAETMVPFDLNLSPKTMEVSAPKHL